MQFPRNDTLESSEDYLRAYANYIVSQFLIIVQCIDENLVSIGTIILLYLILVCSLYVIFCNINPSSRSSESIKSKRRILFVISHPDDECMFFGPAIVNLAKSPDKNVFLLCLSNGKCFNRQHF